MDIRKVAHLARIGLSDEEVATYQAQMDKIVDYVEQLNSVDVEGIEPTAHASAVFDVIREDVNRGAQLTQEQVLSNAPAVAHDQIKMPKVVD
ncbi:MAG: Asp-tRNA(Asn)/Glu-tRNA(Gln) amidotransferase GatCAB subunit C [Verrucomicrobiales bacterium]|nr:Asp-tRNA(Asn)/Glu-tRNA(Gln) amidotransferase GatCAB subunit C [Verrucomicrobiales bacterium]